MNEFLMNFLIGIIIVVGFFIFWGRSAGWFKEGGFVYEWWRKKYPKNNIDDDEKE